MNRRRFEAKLSGKRYLLEFEGVYNPSSVLGRSIESKRYCVPFLSWSMVERPESGLSSYGFVTTIVKYPEVAGYIYIYSWKTKRKVR